MAQDVVGRRDVKEELRDAERQQQRSPGERPGSTVLEREDDVLVPGPVDRVPRQTLEDIRDLSSAMSGSTFANASGSQPANKAQLKTA